MGVSNKGLSCVRRRPATVGSLAGLLLLAGCTTADLAGWGFIGSDGGTSAQGGQDKTFIKAVQEIDAARQKDAAQQARKTGQPVAPPNPLAAIKPDTCAALRNSITPRIHSIGDRKILTFRTVSAGDDPNGIGLEIPIEGRDLIYPGCMQVAAKVTGTVNALKDADANLFTGPTGSGAMSVGLRNRYLKNLRTGDHIDVYVTVNALPKLEPDPNCRLVTYAHRRFTLYTVDDYREMVQKVRVPENDIRAFPLPKEEAEILFGPVVAENFFAVKLTVTNHFPEDVLINTGTITASGRVLVEPKARKGCDQKKAPPFTLPVEIVPQSLEHVYTMVDDKEVDQTRSITFRGLDFVGAIATAIVGAYPGPRDVLTGVSLFTGVGIPELRRAWPDRWPGYERNIVSKSMPDLIKVPKGAAVGHKYVFFSKNKLEAIISDQQYFGTFGDGSQPGQPNVAVAQVRFDSLDIPFEKVFTVEAASIQRQVADLRADLPRVAERMNSLANWGQAASMLAGSLTYQDYQQLVIDLSAAPVSGLVSPAVPAGFTNFVNAAKLAVSDLETDRKALAAAVQQEVAALGAPVAAATPGFPSVGTNVTAPLDTLTSTAGKLATAVNNLNSVFGDMTHIYVSDANNLERLAKALGDHGTALKADLQDLKQIKAAATDPAPVVTMLNKLNQHLEAVAQTVVETDKALADARTSAQIVSGQVETLRAVAKGLLKSNIDAALINDQGHGIVALQNYDRELRNIFADITAGRDISGQREKVTNIRAETDTARRKLDFYSEAATVFRKGDDGPLIAKLKALAGTLPSNRAGWNKAIQDISTSAIGPLKSHHGDLNIIPELTDKPATGS